MFFSVKTLQLNGIQINFSEEGDVFIKLDKNKLTVQSLSKNELQMAFTTKKTTKKAVLKPGESIEYDLKQ